MMTERTVYVAIVHGGDRVLFAASGEDRAEVSARLAAYLDERCIDTLWPSAASEVRELVRAQMHIAAIETYFASVGQRWDPELLSITSFQRQGAGDVDDQAPRAPAVDARLKSAMTALAHVRTRST